MRFIRLWIIRRRQRMLAEQLQYVLDMVSSGQVHAKQLEWKLQRLQGQAWALERPRGLIGRGLFN